MSIITDQLWYLSDTECSTMWHSTNCGCAGSGRFTLELDGETYQLAHSSQAKMPWGVMRRVKDSIRGDRWECCVCERMLPLESSRCPHCVRLVLYVHAGGKSVCPHNKAAGTAPTGDGLSAEAYEAELRDYLGPDGTRALTCISRNQVPEKLNDPHKQKVAKRAQCFFSTVMACMPSIDEATHLVWLPGCADWM